MSMYVLLGKTYDYLGPDDSRRNQAIDLQNYCKCIFPTLAITPHKPMVQKKTTITMKIT